MDDSRNSVFLRNEIDKCKRKNKMNDLKRMRRPAVIAAALLLAACGGGQTAPAGGDYPTLVAETTDRTLETSYSATIRGRQDIDIYPDISGKITELRVTEGESVKRGQVLFVIDRVPYEAAVRVAEANLAAARVGVDKAQLDYDSTKELFDHEVVSSYELQTSLNALQTAQATQAQMEAQLVDARNNLSYTEVKSPSDGVIGTLPYRIGALVGPSIAEPLTTVSDNSEMYVYFSLNENRLLDLVQRYGSLEKALRQMPDIRLELGNGTIYDLPGRVESISGVINTKTGAVQLRAVFPNPDRILFSGANGTVLMPESYAGVIVIPQEATFELQDQVLAYKVVDGKAKSVHIDVASISDGREYIVLSGLEAGDEIVASGAGLMREGMQVKTSVATDAQ